MTLRRKFATMVAAIVLLAASGCAHAELHGEVIRVIDGDTVDFLVDSHPVRIRLAQIDVPEHDQPFGTRSKQQLAAFIYRRTVSVEEAGHDRYRRTIGTIFVDGKDVNREMVAVGMVWAFRRYLTDPRVLELEHAAQLAHRGLWIDPAPVAPWVWRHRRVRSTH